MFSGSYVGKFAARRLGFDACEPRICPAGMFVDLTLSDGASINPRPSGEPLNSNPSFLASVGEWAYFQLGTNQELWRTDGTPSGTESLHWKGTVTGILPYGVHLVIRSATSLWLVDGVRGSVIPLTDGRQTVVGNPVVFAGEIYFVGADADVLRNPLRLGADLMKTDGSEIARLYRLPRESDVQRLGGEILGTWGDRLHYSFAGSRRGAMKESSAEVTEGTITMGKSTPAAAPIYEPRPDGVVDDISDEIVMGLPLVPLDVAVHGIIELTYDIDVFAIPVEPYESYDIKVSHPFLDLVIVTPSGKQGPGITAVSTNSGGVVHAVVTLRPGINNQIDHTIFGQAYTLTVHENQDGYPSRPSGDVPTYSLGETIALRTDHTTDRDIVALEASAGERFAFLAGPFRILESDGTIVDEFHTGVVHTWQAPHAGRFYIEAQMSIELTAYSFTAKGSIDSARVLHRNSVVQSNSMIIGETNWYRISVSADRLYTFLVSTPESTDRFRAELFDRDGVTLLTNFGDYQGTMRLRFPSYFKGDVFLRLTRLTSLLTRLSQLPVLMVGVSENPRSVLQITPQPDDSRLVFGAPRESFAVDVVRRIVPGKVQTFDFRAVQGDHIYVAELQIQNAGHVHLTLLDPSGQVISTAVKNADFLRIDWLATGSGIMKLQAEAFGGEAVFRLELSVRADALPDSRSEPVVVLPAMRSFVGEFETPGDIDVVAIDLISRKSRLDLTFQGPSGGFVQVFDTQGEAKNSRRYQLAGTLLNSITGAASFILFNSQNSMTSRTKLDQMSR